MTQSQDYNMITQKFSTKAYNVQNSNKNKQQQNDNIPPPSTQQHMKSINLPTNKKCAHRAPVI